jgi:hypothetical protein
MNATMLAAVPGSFDDLGAGRVRWRRFDGQAVHELSYAQANLLAACAGFATRAAHEARITNAAGAAAFAPFADLEALGLIRTPAWYLEPPSGQVAPAPPPLLVIRSYERPAGLRRLLDSLLADERRFGVRRCCVVVDDTDDRACAAETERLVRGYAAASESTIALLGPPGRDAALQPLLAGFGADEAAALREMLDPRRPTAVTGSRTWNWAVLLSAGGTLSILDDDTQFPLRVPSAMRSPIQLVDSTECVSEFHDAPVAQALPALDEEPYAHLGRWLGQPARALLGAHGWDAGALWHRAADELLFLQRDARVVGVTPGLYGGIAFGSSAYLVYSNPESQRSLWRAPYRHERLAGDNLWYGYEAPRLTSQGVYTPLLLDNRELLPFAGTWGRIDDTYFLMLLRAIAAPLAVAHLAVALGHIDLEPRLRLARAQEPLLLDRNAYLAHVFARHGERAADGDRESRLRAVGSACAELAGSDSASLRERIHEFRRAMRERLVRHVESGLAAHPDAPVAWRELARRVVEINRRASAEERLDEAEIGRYRAALRQVARVAPCWAELWRRCRDGGAAEAWPGVMALRP